MTEETNLKKEFDWQTLWQQLDWDNPQRQARAQQLQLRQRADQYAAPVETQPMTPAETFTVLTFILGRERYAVDVKFVQGVRTINRVKRVPGTPAFYQGVVNVRGQIISALDLRRFFNLNAVDNHHPDELVIISGHGLTLGLLANHIAEVMALTRKHIEPVDLQYAFGVTPDKLVVLDIESLLADERLIVGGVDTQ